MNVAIIGTGNVGGALGSSLSKAGHSVTFYSRDEQKKADAANAVSATAADSVVAAVESADVIILAVPYAAAADVAREIAPAAEGKVVIDTTNPLDPSAGFPPRLAWPGDSGGERVQRAAPNAKVVKAFNIVGNALMVDPKLPGGPPTMFIAGNDEGAKKTVTDVLTDFGWETIDLGGIEASRLLEPMMWAWVVSAMKTGKWMQAFKMLRA